jgi:hypothetical protein
MDPNIQQLQLGMPKGALGLPPPTRKPTRGNLGGAVPRSGRTRLPPNMAAAQRGGKKAAPPVGKRGAKKRAANKANG